MDIRELTPEKQEEVVQKLAFFLKDSLIQPRLRPSGLLKPMPSRGRGECLSAWQGGVVYVTTDSREK